MKITRRKIRRLIKESLELEKNSDNLLKIVSMLFKNDSFVNQALEIIKTLKLADVDVNEHILGSGSGFRVVNIDINDQSFFNSLYEYMISIGAKQAYPNDNVFEEKWEIRQRLGNDLGNNTDYVLQTYKSESDLLYQGDRWVINDGKAGKGKFFIISNF